MSQQNRKQPSTRRFRVPFLLSGTKTRTKEEPDDRLRPTRRKFKGVKRSSFLSSAVVISCAGMITALGIAVAAVAMNYPGLIDLTARIDGFSLKLDNREQNK